MTGKFGFWVALSKPGAEGVKDGQAGHEDGDPGEGLDASMFRFGARLA
jgi:hypothetical protein